MRYVGQMRVTLLSVGLVSSFLVACGSTSAPAGPGGGDAATGGDAAVGDDGGAADASTGDGGFATAPHTPFPPLAPHAGKVFAAPHVVSMTYAGYNHQREVEDFGNYVVTSSWLKTVGKDYGVGVGTHTAARMTATAPATINDAGISLVIDQAMTAGTVPVPAAGNQNIYIVYFPQSVKIDDGTGSILCSATGAVGYHSVATHGGVDYAYAVLPDCTGKLGDITSTSSHEIIEAATDPFDKPNAGYSMDPPLPNPWYAAGGNEDADLCQYEVDTMDGPWTVQRSWSTSAAAAGGSPCAPAVAGEIYFNTSAAPDTVQKVAAGGSVTFTITGWSTAEKAAWKLKVDPADVSDFDPGGTLSANAIQNGTTVTLTLTAPAGTPRGQVGAVYIASGAFGEHYWPVAIQVK